jgi:hypothetical protein
LSLGVAAVVSSLLPVIGEILAPPTAVLAVALGLIGLQRHETGQAARVIPAIVGVVLGALAGTAAVVVLIATHVSP